MLQRVRDLKVQFDNGTLSRDDKDAIDAEVSQLATEISDIAARPSSTASRCSTARVTFQVGAARTDHRPRPAQLSATRHRARRRRRHCRRDDRGLGGDASLATIDAAIKNVSTRASTSARCRTASSIASTTSPPTRRTWSRPRAGSATWTWPRDGQLHEAPDPAAGRHEHARAGQPGPAGRSHLLR
jgi:hypothetical protein